MTDIVESLEHQLDEFDSGKAIHFDYSGLRALIAEIRCLREVAEAAEKDRDSALAISRKTHDQWSAADRECATLSARLAKASEALRPFEEQAKVFDEIPGVYRCHDNVELWQKTDWRIPITVGDIRNARTVRKEIEDK